MQSALTPFDPPASLYALSLLITLNCRQNPRTLRGVTTSAFGTASDRARSKEKDKQSTSRLDMPSFSRTVTRVLSKERKPAQPAGIVVSVVTETEEDVDRTVHGGRRRARLGERPLRVAT